MTLIDQMWLVICALFVFFMQAGFICYEVGFIQPKNVISVAIENIIAFVIATLSFFAVGYALMFGPSVGGLVGTDFWFGTHIEGGTGFMLAFFELMFAGTAITIFSGSMSERTRTNALIISAVVVGALIYPIYGHWVWGSQYLSQSVWLNSMGFIDFAGATVVHGTAGWIALAGIMVVGPRKDRWDEGGKIRNIGRSNIPFAALGTFILWFSWFGFNGGSLMKFNGQIGLILMNTNLSACAGVLGAVGTVTLFQKNRSTMEAIFGGALGGLVAITACSNLVEPYEAFLIGFVSGAVIIMGSVLLESFKIDDAVGAVSIHAFGGMTGTLLAAFFADPEQLVGQSHLNQFAVQLVGCIVNFIWAFGLGFIMFKLIDRFVGLRVSAEAEEMGLNIVEFSDVYSWEQAIKEKSYVNLTEELYEQIQSQNAILEKQSQRLITTQERERDKIARDLHDGVGQLLAAAKIDLGMLRRKFDDAADQEQLNRIIKLMDRTVEEIRMVIFDLKPVQLENQGLLKSIQIITDQLHKISGIEFNYHVINPLPEWGETETLNIFRIIQEGLNNAMKHSSAIRVDLVFSKSGDGLYAISIIDDGKGFEGSGNGQGIGLTSMRERSQLLGGHLRFDSTPSRGTTIILEIPYEEN